MGDFDSIASNIPATHKYVINHVLKKIMDNAYIDSIFLFGSCVKGFANEDSDIDMLVITHNKIQDDNHEAFELIYGSTDDIPLDEYISCDILTTTKDEFLVDSTPLIKIVKREGIELHGLL